MKRFISSMLCIILLFSMVDVALAYTDTMKVGDTRSYRSSDAPTSYPAYGAVSRIHTWYTSDSSVVQIVSYSGASCSIKAVGPGKATISNKQTLSYITYGATGERACYEGGLGDSWVVTVNPVDPTGISLPDKFEVVAESYDTITPTFSPSNAMSDLSWSSSNTSIVTVEGGSVYGVTPGNATITVTTANGFSDTCNVTVTTPQNIFSVASPADGRENIDKNTNIKFTFNNKLTQGTAYSSIKLYDNTTSKTISINKSIDGKNLILTPTLPLSPGHSYTATVPQKALKNLYGVNNGSQVTTTFKTAPLAIESSSPENNSFDVDTTKVVTIKFDAPIEKSTKWNSIKATDEAGNNISVNTSVSGNTLTIAPATSWDYYTKHIISIPAGAVACDKADCDEDINITFKTIRNADVVYPPEYSFENGKLTITAEPNTQVYYTLDGGLPLVSGKLYTLPILPPYNIIHVRAVAVRNGKTSVESEYDCINNNLISATAIGSKKQDIFTDVSSDTDGYVAVGDANTEGFYYGDWKDALEQGEYDAIIVKYDNSNNLLWKKNFGGEADDRFNSVITTQDGYVAVGYSDGDSFGTGDWEDFRDKGYEDAIIVKFDKNGNIVWKKNFGGTDSTSFSQIIADEDGYVVVGEACWYDEYEPGTNDFAGIYGNGYCDGIIVKFDTDGNVIWKKIFGGYDDDRFLSVSKTDDGYVAVGTSYYDSFGTGDLEDVTPKGYNYEDSIIVKFDKNGDIIWKKSFGGKSYDRFYKVITLEDGYIVAGYSDTGSFGTGDLADESYGDGGSENIAVKYAKNGNILWIKNFTDGYDNIESITNSDNGFATSGVTWLANGEMVAFVSEFDKDGKLLQSWSFDGDDEENFIAVTKSSQKGYIAVGYTYSEEFYSDGASEILNKGSNDALAVQFHSTMSVHDNFISHKVGKVGIGGQERVVKGDEITVPLYFTPTSHANAVSVKLVYPEGISILRADSDYEYIFFEENSDGVTITADISDINDRVSPKENCHLANLIFQLDPSLDEGDCSISIDESDTFYMDDNYDIIPFSDYEDYHFTVTPLVPKAISISGNPEISEPTQYKALYVPENAETKVLEWSVSDERIATIDSNGFLTPLKNGEVKVILTEPESQTSTSLDVVISDIKTYITNIKTDTGIFEKEYTPYETERTLYVPKGTTSLKLTLDYNAGNATSGGGIFFKNVAKQVNISSLPYKLTITKKESDCISTDYNILITDTHQSELIPDIQIQDKEIALDIVSKTYDDAMLVVAIYDGTALKNISLTQLPAGEINVISRVPIMGNKLKIMLVDKDNFSPLCKNYVVNY